MLSCQGYNVDVAKKYGVTIAVFLSIISQNENEDKAPFLSFDDIRNMSGLTEEEIVQSINTLTELNALGVVNGKNSTKKYFYTDYDKIYDTQKSKTETISKNVVDNINVKEKKKEDKKNAIVYNLKNTVSEKNESVRDMYYSWIEAIMENPKSFLSKIAVQKTQEMLNAYTNNDEIKKNVLDIAIRNCYRDISWAINSYERNAKKIVNNNFENYFDVRADDVNMTNGVF